MTKKRKKKLKKIKHRSPIPPPSHPIDERGYNRRRAKKLTRQELADASVEEHETEFGESSGKD